MTTLRASAAAARRAQSRRRMRYRWLAAIVGIGALGLGIAVSIPASAVTSTWTAVSAGATHTCGIKTDTTLWCWGQNNVGQLGTGNFTNRTSPTVVSSAGSGWTVISAGTDFTCGIRSALRYCWGLNSSGQLGLGDYTNRNTPQRRSGETQNWATVDAGLRHACGARTSGTGQCWGDNSNGQLGLGDRTTRNTATALPSASQSPLWSKVSSGLRHTCGIRADATLYCWGYNRQGQLGISSTVDKTTPTLVP